MSPGVSSPAQVTLVFSRCPERAILSVKANAHAAKNRRPERQRGGHQVREGPLHKAGRVAGIARLRSKGG